MVKIPKPSTTGLKRIVNDGDYEEDCGFKFRRLSSIQGKSAPSQTVVPSADTATTGTVSRTAATTTTQASKNALNTAKLVNVIKTMLPPSQPPTSTISNSFTFNPTATVAAATTGSSSSNNLPPLKRTRRKSSFAMIASRASGRPSASAAFTSSFSVSITTKLPPTNVNPADYHKHLLPDLPGPIKMRQLMIWAVQRVVSTSYQFNRAVSAMAEQVVRALHSNLINTSWYNRPTTSPTNNNVDSDGQKTGKGPKNLELLESIQLYERYQQRLRIELEEWQTRLSQPSLKKVLESGNEKETIRPTPLNLPHSLSMVVPDLSDTVEWMNNKLPRGVDQLQWMLEVTSAFEQHSREYCENVFQQIRNRLLAEGGSGDSINEDPTLPKPILLMRALTSATTAGMESGNE